MAQNKNSFPWPSTQPSNSSGVTTVNVQCNARSACIPVTSAASRVVSIHQEKTTCLRLLLVTEIAYFYDTWKFLGSNDACDRRQYNASGQFGGHAERTCVRPAFRGIRFESRPSLALSWASYIRSIPHFFKIYFYIILRHVTGSRAHCRLFE
jgi:hypothetical protein